MQKLADAPLATCPACGKANYVKKISAAGFALKGSGWYVTDFRNGSQKPAGDAKKSGDTPTPADSSTSPASNGAAAPAAAPAPSPAPAPAAAPAVNAG